MNIRFQNSPAETGQMNTAEIRENFLVSDLFIPGKVSLVYSHYDRVIIGAAVPEHEWLLLPNPGELKADYFLERRELGIINVGGKGVVSVNGQEYELDKLDCLYIGKESADVKFGRSGDDQPLFYLLSAPAHKIYPTTKMKATDASPVNLGAVETSNKRVIRKFIHKDGIKSCQLVMGVTILETGSVWNSVPPHTHTRRMEVYFYFDLPEASRVFHFMGEAQQTRHISVANHQAVISPPWSVHFGCGTTNYGFIWAMAGENQEFSDMDQVAVAELL